MLVKYKYNYVSAEPVWAQVKEELQSYFESNAINDSMFPKYTEDLIRKLGYSALVVKEEILPLKNFIAYLPEDAVYVNDVLYASGDNKLTTRKDQVTYNYKMECIPVSCEPLMETDNPITYKEIRVVEKETKDVITSFNKIMRLKPSTLRAKQMCETDAFKIFMNSPHYYDINGRLLNTNISDGHLYIRYKAMLKDDNGFPLVPENIKFEEALISYLKYKLFEYLWNTVSDETFAQVQGKMTFYKGEYGEKLIDARTEFMSSSFGKQKQNIMRSRNRFRGNYNIR
jgi:hypothetical protein